jgi:hypothetical protein
MRNRQTLGFILVLALGIAGVVVASPRVALELAKEAPAAPLSAPEITQARAKPVKASENDKHTQDIGTTPVHLLRSDLTADQRSDERFVQIVRITNRHASQTLCWAPFAFSSQCATTCSGSGLTCSGATPVDGGVTTDGDPIPPGVSIEVPLASDQCACAVGSASGTKATAMRFKRGP